MYRFILWNIVSLIFSTIQAIRQGDTTRYTFNTPWFNLRLFLSTVRKIVSKLTIRTMWIAEHGSNQQKNDKPMHAKFSTLYGSRIHYLYFKW